MWTSRPATLPRSSPRTRRTTSIGGILHPDTREPQLAIFLREKTDYVVLDQSLREDWDAMKRIDPDGEPILTGRDHADRTWLIAFDSDAGPVKYYAFDRDTKNATFLFDHNAVLNDYTLAPMEPFSYKARDGLEVHGYITFPLDVERSNLPLVVNVHGGPWARDMWGFHPEAQCFANRGYLHIQVNFRGSTGYGKDFLNAGDREWGGKMQDDITRRRRLGDRRRASPIRPASASTAGRTAATPRSPARRSRPTSTRARSRCVGPSNLKTFIESIPPYWAPMLAMFKTRVGDPETEEEFLWSRSPLSKVDDIKIPMLIAHGANDPRVKLAETEQIIAGDEREGHRPRAHGVRGRGPRLREAREPPEVLRGGRGVPGEAPVTAPLTKVERIPLDVLFGNPERTSPEVSPDGRKLAYLAPVDGVLNVWVGDIGGDDFAPVTSDADRGIRQFAFAHDNEHLIYIQDQGGDENWRLYTVDLETREVVDRTPFDQVQARVVATSKRRPHELLLGLNVDNKQLHDVYHLDLRTGELAKVAENPGFLGWIVDYEFAVRGAIKPTGDGGREVLVRDTVDDEWRTVVTFDADDGELSGPVGFTRDGASLLLRSAIGVNAARLVSFDLATGAEDEIIADANYDVAGVVRHGDTWDVQIVSFLKDRVEMVVIDEAIAEDIAALRALEEGELSIIDRDHGDATWIVGFGRDDGPTRYFAWNRTTKAATFLFEESIGPRCVPTREDGADHVRSAGRARDPRVHHVPGRRRPLEPPMRADGARRAVVARHVGLPRRTRSGWRTAAGCACRSTTAARSATGRSSSTPATASGLRRCTTTSSTASTGRCPRDTSIADRVAIMGGSYGGLRGPRRVRRSRRTCSVARSTSSGPSNLITLIESFPAYWKPNIARWHRRVGNPETDRDFLWSRSPLSRVDDIQIPMLIGQGANDPRVTQIESEQIVDAMKAKGIDHEYLLFEDEGHGFAKPENRLRFMEAADAFLASTSRGRSGAHRSRA